MFQFFEKKRYLVDQLENFVDIHNHILPGIDDGAADLDASVELVRAFGELGVHRFIATPHILQPLYPNTRKTIHEAHDQLMDALMDQRMNQVAVEPAAEHMVDDSFEELLESGGYLKFRKGYLLVEMSFLQPPLNFDRCIVEIAKRGLTPILAHPERYQFLHQKRGKYRKYAEQGILMQLNMLSLGNYYGPEVQKMAYELLESDLINFLGSDVHNLRQLEAIKEISLRPKHLVKLETAIQHTIGSFY